ncbi:MAG: hypothetical protein PHS44_04475 [Candidatus Dojkabacteria bacterium]|nr:hypothetical protein [Candidatus Dojkabacteria bacterium]
MEQDEIPKTKVAYYEGFQARRILQSESVCKEGLIRVLNAQIRFRAGEITDLQPTMLEISHVSEIILEYFPDGQCAMTVLEIRNDQDTWLSFRRVCKATRFGFMSSGNLLSLTQAESLPYGKIYTSSEELRRICLAEIYMVISDANQSWFYMMNRNGSRSIGYIINRQGFSSTVHLVVDSYADYHMFSVDRRIREALEIIKNIRRNEVGLYLLR